MALKKNLTVSKMYLQFQEFNECVYITVPTFAAELG